MVELPKEIRRDIVYDSGFCLLIIVATLFAPSPFNFLFPVLLLHGLSIVKEDIEKYRKWLRQREGLISK